MHVPVGIHIHPPNTNIPNAPIYPIHVCSLHKCPTHTHNMHIQPTNYCQLITVFRITLVYTASHTHQQPTYLVFSPTSSKGDTFRVYFYLKYVHHVQWKNISMEYFVVVLQTITKAIHTHTYTHAHIYRHMRNTYLYVIHMYIHTCIFVYLFVYIYTYTRYIFIYYISIYTKKEKLLKH